MSGIGFEPIFMAHETIELPITPSKFLYKFILIKF
jgi:hypothetical protein